MSREAISPGTASQEMNECDSAEGTAVGMDIPSASEDQGENTGNVGCGTPASEEENAASDVKVPSSRALDQPVMGRKSTTVQMSPLSVPVSSGCSDSSADPADLRRPSDGSAAEWDCLICFNRYSCSRQPKVLACRHVFCAVCLKLMLRNEDGAWRIACPVCRKVTTVFGGLICSLPVKVGVGHSGDPGPNTEMPFAPDALSGTLVIQSAFSISQGEERSTRVAAKRLLFLLLLLVILIIFILPIMYGGLMKWVLCVAVALGLIMAGVLCCDPNWRCRCPNVLPPFW
uniref:E3 ubiquitin-protein ligase RNF186-like n=1 Tax=Euleptes europaea TaxID=460621 RepID=UPI0025410F5B|nr:E3 ubiquitin-protein ligase RNF186-like [Euleptes europaea]